MRLASFTLHRYGNYAAERICFATAPGTVNILLAPNSAGKSVLRNAFADLLFGIHNQTPMGFRFGYPNMRVSAELVRRDGTNFAFGRRKVRGNVISDDSGQALDPALLHAMLGGRDRAFLERLFVLDTEGLRKGGRALLESNGDVASALLSAAGGIRQARALKQRLEKQRDELAPVRRTALRPFYLALDKFLEARRGSRAETLLPDEWFRQERELQALIDQQRESNAAADAASAEIARLERIRRVRPALARHAEAISWLASHQDAPSLSPDLPQLLAAARLEVVTQQDATERTRAALLAASDSAEEVIVDADLLACAEPIERLIGDAGAARKARNDLPGVTGQYEHGLTKVRDLLRQLGSTLAPEQANETLPKTALLARTRALIESYGEIAAAARNADGQIEELARDLATIERRIGDMPSMPDAGPLASLVETIRADGDPAARLAEAQRTLLDVETALNAACAQVPGWSGRVAALAAIAPLAMEIYARHDKEVSAARSRADTARQRHDDETGRLEQVRNALAAIAKAGTIPDEAALLHARARRDTLWQQIYRRAFMGEAVPETDAQSGLPLPLAFERATAEADTVADRRVSESELLARVATARQTVADAEQRAEATAERLRIADETLTQTLRNWAQICAALPLGDGPALAEIQAFVAARARVIDALRQRDLGSGRVTALAGRHTEWAAALAAQLVHHSTDLPVLLALADRMLTQMREQREERIKLDTRKAQLAEQLRAATGTKSVQDRKLDAWRERWRSAMEELARPQDEEPGVTGAVLETLREVAGEHRETTSLAERISGMHAVIGRFTRSVGELVQTLPSSPVADDPFDAVRDLSRALTRQRELEERRRVLHRALETARTNVDATEHAQVAAQTKQRAILDLIGAETIDAAEQLLALSAERAHFEALRHSAAAELHDIGDGFSIAALRAEAEQIAPDEVPARIEAAATARKAASDTAQRIAEAVSALRQRMDHEATDANVNKAAAEQQAAIASLSRTLDDALVYHTAAVLLGRALEVIEKSTDSTLLQQLSGIFQSLTNGAYSGVVTELDDEGTARLGLLQRDFPEERQSIEQLSEGTRDQLFLALRVAAIEHHLRTAEPLPFIGDDILQTFDDDRALAALRVLSELSQHTQVIVLTHHRHILELASGLPPAALFECRREQLATAI